MWQEADIHTGFNIEFAVLADMDNDGKANEVVAQENGTPQAWYEAKNGAWVAHEISDKSYGHGIGAGDVNGDKRTDILTPRGWLEAPADPRAGNWTFHADWEAINVPLPVAGQPPAAEGAQPKLLELGFMHVLDVNGDGRNDVDCRRRAQLRPVLVRAGHGRPVDAPHDRCVVVAGARLDASST